MCTSVCVLYFASAPFMVSQLIVVVTKSISSIRIFLCGVDFVRFSVPSSLVGNNGRYYSYSATTEDWFVECHTHILPLHISLIISLYHTKLASLS